MCSKRQYHPMNANDILHLMGIETWVSRANITSLSAAQSIGSADFVDHETQLSPAANTASWEELQKCVRQCTACVLCKTRTQTVFGVGNPHADILFIGEAPGANEDLQGEPFVGKAGQLLDNMLASIGLDRKQIFIANILKCRPPQNRDPQPQEVASCTPFLQRQIELIQPKLLVALGRIAAQFLLATPQSLGSLRKKQHFYGQNQIPLIVTYHPAYLLRTPRDKAKAYEDLLNIAEIATH